MKWVFRILGVAAVLAAAAAAAVYFIPAVQDRIVASQIEAAFKIQRDDLVGDDALRVAICGSGSPMPDPNCRPACHVVMAGGHILVVDAGPGSWSNASGWRIPMNRIEGVFLTHFHSDHIGDLGEVNLQSWVAGRPQRLTVYGGPGVDRVVNGFNEAFAMDASHRIAHHGADYLKPELGTMDFQVLANAAGGALEAGQDVVVYDRDGLKVTAFAVDHHPILPAYGYRFDYKGRSVVFTGDTVKDENIARYSRGADVLISEAMLMQVVEEMQRVATEYGRDRFSKILHDIRDYHIAPGDAADLAAEAGVKHLIFSHVIPPLPQWLGERMFTRDTGRPGLDVRLGFDGMLITLPADGGDAQFDDLGP
ncbi:MAG: MBL fold metallo-hydrolase [Micropepsaceae bacterium]